MRNYLAALLIAFLYFSCDQLDQPYQYVKYRYKEELYGPAPTFSRLSSVTKNVLFEEFTGHLCGFCPTSTKLVLALDSTLGPRLVTVSIHAGTLAVVGNAPFDANYNTVPGNQYWSQLNGGFNPCARIDRNGGLSSFEWIDPDNPANWQGIVTQRMNQSPEAGIQLQADFVSTDNVVNIHTATQFQSAKSGNYNLVVLLVESHIISAQEDYDHDPTEILDYEHMHVLRAAVTETMGNQIASNPNATDVYTSSYTFPLQSGWNGHNCTVVAYLIDPSSQQIINAVEHELD
jgi:hypothetical protein